MQKLSSPFKLIESSIKIFFDKKNLIYFILVYAVLVPFQAFQYFRESLNLTLLSGVIATVDILYLVIYLLISLAGIMAVKKVVDNENLSIKETFVLSWKKLWGFFLVSVLVFLVDLGGTILLIIPGIIFAIWFSFSTFVFVDKELGVKASMSKSKALVKGRFWAILGRFIIFGLFGAVLGLAASYIPYSIGSYILTLLGALTILPSYLLYKELND
jgi:hypothetical protein